MGIPVRNGLKSGGNTHWRYMYSVSVVDP